MRYKNRSPQSRLRKIENSVFQFFNNILQFNPLNCRPQVTRRTPSKYRCRFLGYFGRCVHYLAFWQILTFHRLHHTGNA